MAKKGKPQQPGSSRTGAAGATGRSSTDVTVRQVLPDAVWELVHPRCALERTDDLEEVHNMIAMGEAEVAIDELRFLLDGCTDFIAAHRLLGEIALGESDLPLARGHFGYAFTIGKKAIKKAGVTGPLPYGRESNQAFYEAGKGLAYCLSQLGKREMAREVVDDLLRYDPSDPLGVRGLLDAPPQTPAEPS